MIVHFIGAGPGAPDLITVRGLKLVRECPVVLFAGSLIPKDILAECRDDAKIVDTADLTLDQIVAEFVDAHAEGMDVARLHSGDPSIYGAVAEQMRHLDRLGINYDVVPGVPAFAAAAAMLKRELTLPGISQSVILTRTSTNSSPMPVGEDLATLGRSGATLALHLSAANLDKAAKCLIPHYGADCPAILAYRVSWPDQSVIHATLSSLAEKAAAAGIRKTALVLVGRVLGDEEFSDSRLYAPPEQSMIG